MGLLGTLKQPQLYIADLLATYTAAVSAERSITEIRKKGSAQGQLESRALPPVTAPTIRRFSSNPLIGSAIDSVNKQVASYVSTSIKNASKKNEGVFQDIDAAGQVLFSSLALANAAPTALALVLAQKTASRIVPLLIEKEALIDKLAFETRNLILALSLLVDSSPFFSRYQADLINAFNLIKQSRAILDSVLSGVEGPAQTFRASQFDRSLVGLKQALDLIIPDTDNVQKKRLQDLIQKLPGDKPKKVAADLVQKAEAAAALKDSIAAAIAVAAISKQIGALFLTYARLTLEINGLLIVFRNSLNDFFATYDKSQWLLQAQAAQLRAGIKDLDTLMGSMAPVLFPPAGSGSITKKDLYPARVTAQASTWATRLSSTISFLELTPKAAGSVPDQVDATVRQYYLTVDRISKMGNVKRGLATLEVSGGVENLAATQRTVISLLVGANTIVAKRTVADTVLQKTTQIQDLLSASRDLTGRLRSELESFAATSGQTLNNTKTAVELLIKQCKDLNFDRAEKLFEEGRSSELLGMNPKIMTFTGAAVQGFDHVMKLVKASPNATDSDSAKIERLSDEVRRMDTVKRVETFRSTASLSDTFLREREKTLARLEDVAKEVVAVPVHFFSETYEGIEQGFKLEYIEDAISQAIEST